jgi:uncharacterized membrane protein
MAESKIHGFRKVFMGTLGILAILALVLMAMGSQRDLTRIVSWAISGVTGIVGAFMGINGWVHRTQAQSGEPKPPSETSTGDAAQGSQKKV